MNEQIEKIYGEACITAGYLDEREFLEKFAQLIVRESVKALWTEDCHVSDLAIIDFNEKKRKIFNHMGITE
jgi:hypothetical protein